MYKGMFEIGDVIYCGEGLCATCTHPTHFEECEYYEEACEKENCNRYERKQDN